MEISSFVIPQFWVMVVLGFIGSVVGHSFIVGGQGQRIVTGFGALISMYLFGLWLPESTYWPVGSAMIGGYIGLLIGGLEGLVDSRDAAHAKKLQEISNALDAIPGRVAKASLERRETDKA